MIEVSKVFVITGPSGVGKGTLISRLLERVPELELSVSATTRSPRHGEVDGRDYHFLDPEEFERRVANGDFLEHATYSGHRYGTLRSEVEKCLQAGKSVVLEIELQGARQVRRRDRRPCGSSSPRPIPPTSGAASRAVAPTIPTRSSGD